MAPAAPKQQAKPKFTLKKLLKPEFLPVFEQAHGSVAAEVGTAAHDYTSRKLRIAEVEQDSRYLGAVPQPDGALLLFDDGSTALALQGGFTPTESRAITDGMLGKIKGAA